MADNNLNLKAESSLEIEKDLVLSTVKDIKMKDNRKNDQTFDKKDGPVPTFVLLLLLLNVVMSALIVVSVFYFNTERSVEIKVPVSDLCLSCKEVQLYPEENLENQNFTVDKLTDTCCVKYKDAPVLVAHFTNLWAKKKLTQDDNTFMYCTSDAETQKTKPSIKVVGLNTPQEDNGHHRLSWDAASEIGIHPDSDREISYNDKDHEIRIKKSGMYHVYSQVTFEHSSNLTRSSHPLIFCHMVFHVKAGTGNEYSDEIMRSMKTTCDCDDVSQDVTSYIGSVFQLEKGDALFVKVYYKEKVKAHPHVNFFGAHML